MFHKVSTPWTPITVIYIQQTYQTLWLLLSLLLINSPNLSLPSLCITEDWWGGEQISHLHFDGCVFNMLMTLIEQKITVGHSGIFLQLFSSLFSSFHPLSPLLLLAWGYLISSRFPCLLQFKTTIWEILKFKHPSCEKKGESVHFFPFFCRYFFPLYCDVSQGLK